MVAIIPAILENNFEAVEEKLSRVAGLVPLVQLDALDGSLVPGARSWPYQSARKPDLFFDEIASEAHGLPFWDRLDFEAHLMLRDPEAVLEPWVFAGAVRIILQIEGAKNFPACVAALQGRVEVGVALALDTPTDVLSPVAEHVSVIQAMGWNFSQLGFQGRPFDEGTLDRVRQLRRLFPKHIISVDGGVNLQNAPRLAAAGATRLVVGSALFGSPDLKAALAQFRSL